MATQSLALGRAWTEVVAELGLVAGTEYYVTPIDGAVELLVSASAAAPGADARGRPVWPGTASRAPDSQLYTAAAGEYLWARSTGARAGLVFDDQP